MQKRNLSAFLIFFCFLFFYQNASAKGAPALIKAEFAAERFYRTELYFGTEKPDGGAVSDEEWAQFLAQEVTPRFPDGFTVLEGFGQYRDSSGRIVKEKSRCLILFYTKKEKKANNEKIDQIRIVYKQKFQQESVLRLDFRQSVNVSF